MTEDETEGPSYRLLFGDDVPLADARAQVAGFDVDPEGWQIRALHLERGLLFMKETRTAPEEALLREDGRLQSEATWKELAPFEAHGGHGPTFLPTARVHFVDRSATRRVVGRLAGFIADGDLRIQQFGVRVRGKLRLLPVAAVVFQNNEWVYVPESRARLAELAEYH